MCSCNRATFTRAFSRRLLPFDFRESWRWRRASLQVLLVRNLQFGYSTPSEVMANAFSPMSRPTAAPVEGNGAISTSVQQRETKYFPDGFWEMVADRIRPLTSFEIRHFTRPSFGSWTKPPTILMFVPTHLLLYDWRRLFLLLNFGNPGFSPFFTRRKKFW